ncbi:unnamed protein product [Spodoptera littoralis]|uniref:Uncharacterized protein n=1 Tax=Spodoptera littoralis TaxID=7109 RepID=A0A9P0I2U1_SPOLI|nr:unnamed protein product [Spodoptera littoralis]CAH1640271.1 unnamed protein product [Spodoptera littoralis]
MSRQSQTLNYFHKEYFRHPVNSYKAFPKLNKCNKSCSSLVRETHSYTHKRRARRLDDRCKERQKRFERTRLCTHGVRGEPGLLARRPAEVVWLMRRSRKRRKLVRSIDHTRRARNVIHGPSSSGPDCPGLARRYHECNTAPCPGPVRDPRVEQCAMYDRRPFRGRFYTWVPYVDGKLLLSVIIS